MRTAGGAAAELLVWFLLGCIAVNVVMHAPQFASASDASFGYVTSVFNSLTSRKA